MVNRLVLDNSNLTHVFTELLNYPLNAMKQRKGVAAGTVARPFHSATVSTVHHTKARPLSGSSQPFRRQPGDDDEDTIDGNSDGPLDASMARSLNI